MPILYDIETDGLYLEGIEKGIAKGMQQGIEKGVIEAIKKMLHSNLLSIQQIAGIIGVTEEKILEIKKEMKKDG